MRKSSGDSPDRHSQESSSSWSRWLSNIQEFIRTEIHSFADIRHAVFDILLAPKQTHSDSYPKAQFEDLCATPLIWESPQNVRDFKLSKEGDAYTIRSLTLDPRKVADSLRKLQAMYAEEPSDVHQYFAEVFERLLHVFREDPQYFYTLIVQQQFFVDGMHCPEPVQAKLGEGSIGYLLHHRPDEYGSQLLLDFERDLVVNGQAQMQKMTYLDGFLHRRFAEALSQQLKSGNNVPEFDPREYSFADLRTDFLKRIESFLNTGHYSPEMNLFTTQLSYLRALAPDSGVDLASFPHFRNPISPFLYPQMASDDPAHRPEVYEAFDRVYDLAFPLGIMEGLKDPLDLIQALSQAVEDGRFSPQDLQGFRRQYSLSALADAVTEALSLSQRLEISQDCLNNPIRVLNPFQPFDSPRASDHFPSRSFALHNLLLKEVYSDENGVCIDPERCQPYEVSERDLRYMASQIVGVLYSICDDVQKAVPEVEDTFEELCERLYPYFPRADLLGMSLSSPAASDRKTTLSYQLQYLLPAIEAMSRKSYHSQGMLQFFIQAVEMYLVGDATYQVVYGLMKHHMLEVSYEIDAEEMKSHREDFEDSVHSLGMDFSAFSQGQHFPDFVAEQRLNAQFALTPSLRRALGFRLFLLSLTLCVETRLDGFEDFGKVFKQSLDKWRQLQKLMNTPYLGNQVLAIPFFHAVVCFQGLPLQQPKMS